MMVIVANDTPPAIRGLLKRWFVEPKPNVFVGSVNTRTREKVLEYIRRNGQDVGMLVMTDDQTSQGFAVQMFGETDRRIVKETGHYLIVEKWDESEDNIEKEEG